MGLYMTLAMVSAISISEYGLKYAAASAAISGKQLVLLMIAGQRQA